MTDRGYALRFGAGDRAQLDHKAKEGKFDHCRTKAKSMPVHDVERRVRVRAPFNRGVLEFGQESVIDFTRSD